jgi:hypothetical protein
VGLKQNLLTTVLKNLGGSYRSLGAGIVIGTGTVECVGAGTGTGAGVGAGAGIVTGTVRLKQHSSFMRDSVSSISAYRYIYGCINPTLKYINHNQFGFRLLYFYLSIQSCFSLKYNDKNRFGFNSSCFYLFIYVSFYCTYLLKKVLTSFNLSPYLGFRDERKNLTATDNYMNVAKIIPVFMQDLPVPMDLIDLSEPPAEGVAKIVQTTAPAHPPLAAQPQPPTAMDQDSSATAPNLGNLYKQCKNARDASTTVLCTRFESAMTFSTGTAKATRIGNLDMIGDIEVEKSFHGARICKGQKTVNECMSSSFDPRNYMCVGCKLPHKIGEKGPLTISFSDQNMVPFVTDGEGNCMAVVRLENATLTDLVDLSFEMLGKLAPPPAA